MSFRQAHTTTVAAAKAGFSTAAVDRLVHHVTILEMNVIKSYRHNEALERKRGKGRPAARATIKTTSD